jgi:hypothetical protein
MLFLQATKLLPKQQSFILALMQEFSIPFWVSSALSIGSGTGPRVVPSRILAMASRRPFTTSLMPQVSSGTSRPGVRALADAGDRRKRAFPDRLPEGDGFPPPFSFLLCRMPWFFMVSRLTSRNFLGRFSARSRDAQRIGLPRQEEEGL